MGNRSNSTFRRADEVEVLVVSPSRVQVEFTQACAAAKPELVSQRGVLVDHDEYPVQE